MDEYLHTVYGGALYSFIHQGVDGSPIGNGLEVRFSPGSNQDFNWASYIIPVDGAVPAFENAHAPGSGYYTGLSFSGGYKLVFFNWGYEGLAGDLPNYARRDTVLARIIDFFSSLTTEVADDKDRFTLPKTFELSQNFPNPFNPYTTIEYTIRSTNGGPIPSTVLKIYNVLGQDIKTLVNEKQRPGVYRVQWDGTNDSGKMVASGIYFYSLYRGANRETRKMVLLK